MAIPTTRQSLKEYCLRDLGAPVLEINVDDDQLEDRIDQALDFWRLYHYDGIEKLYMKHQIRASEMNLTTSTATSFNLAENVVGATSGATAQVCKETQRSSSGTMLLVRDASTPITLREYDNKYIEINDWVYGITRVIPFANASSSKNLFDLQYQLRLNDLYDLTSTSIIYYKTVMSHLAMLDLELNGYPLYRFNRMQGRLYLDINWKTDIPLGDYLVVEAYRALDPSTWSKIWNEQWLKKYVTALFKRQWGTNLKKFQGIQLPGGVTLDGDKLFSEANEEIAQLEDDLMRKSAPLEFFLG